MKIELHKSDDLNARLTIHLEEKDYEPAILKSVAEYGKKIKMPGFRPGKVPASMVRKMIEKDLKAEEVQKVAQHEIEKYLKYSEIDLVLSPLSAYKTEDINWQAKDFELSYDVGLRPQFEPKLESVAALPKAKIEVNADEAIKDIDSLRRRAAHIERMDKVEDLENANVALELLEVEEDGSPLDGGMRKFEVVDLSVTPKPFKDWLIGKEKGSKEVIKISDYLNEEEIGKILGIDKLTVKDLNPDFQVQIMTPFQAIPSELNQEFFDKYLPEGQVKTEEEFMTEWQKTMGEHYTREAGQKYYAQMKEALMKETEMKFPRKFLEKYYLATSEEKDMTPNLDLESELDKFEEELKWLLISEKIASEHALEVKEDDILAYAENMLLYQKEQQGKLEGLDAKTLRKETMDYLRKDSNHVRILMLLRDSNVYKWLEEKYPATEQIMTLDEYQASLPEAHDHEHSHQHNH